MSHVLALSPDSSLKPGHSHSILRLFDIELHVSSARQPTKVILSFLYPYLTLVAESSDYKYDHARAASPEQLIRAALDHQDEIIPVTAIQKFM